MEYILVYVEVNQGLVQVQDEVSAVVGYAGRKKGIGWHFENLPLQSLIQKTYKLKGIDGV